MYRKALVCALSLTAFLGLSAFSAQRMAPHVTPASGLVETYVLIENISDTALSYALTPYSQDGEAMTVVSGEVAAGQRLYLPASELVGTASHFSMEGDDLLKLSLDYNRGESGKKALTVPVIEDGAASWTFHSGDWSYERDSLAVVNMGEHTTPVWLHQRNREGKIVASQRLSEGLAPGAKLLHVIEPQSFKSGLDTYMEVIGDQYLAMTALRGNSAGKLSYNPSQRKRMAESERDDAGIWFITDGSLSDVFEMMGYNVATDRLWQGEIFRRSGQGTMSEIFGPSMVETDMQIRATGYSVEELEAGFASLTEEEQTIISAYVDGFNRRIAELRADPTQTPFEFLALGLPIADWTVVDVMGWATTLQHNFASGFGALYQLSYLNEAQYLLNNFGQFAGASMFMDLHWLNDPNAETMIPNPTAKTLDLRKPQQMVPPILREGVPDIRDVYERLQAAEDNRVEELKKVGGFIKGGSYAWVVSGDLTESGNPILYSGPQLEGPFEFQAPAIVQEGSIRGGGIEVSGLVITGIPAVIVGRTPHHAWSFQVGHANHQDLYFDSPANIISQRVEQINVAGGDPVTVPIIKTTNGVVINEEPLISFKTAMWNYEFNFVKATLDMARASDMDSFGDAVEQLAVSMHICYADTEGNIAYWHTGREPVRPHGNWVLPQGVVSAPLSWDTDVIHPLIHDRNNPRGFYGGWNNKASNEYVDLSGSFRETRWHRAHVITEYLAAGDNFTYDELANLSPRIASTSGSLEIGNNWTFVRRAFMEAVNNHPTPERLAAVDMLENWNGISVTGEEADWVYSQDFQDAFVLIDRWLLNVMPLVYNDEFNPQFYGNNRFRSRLMNLFHMLEPDSGLRKSYNWFRNDQGGLGDRDSIIVAALDTTLQQLGEGPWGVGQRPLTAFNHPFFGDLTELVPSIATPVGNRATYAQCIEMGSEGPVRIGSLWLLGPSGDVRLDANGNPMINPFTFTMTPYFSSYQLRPFPLFD